MCSLSRICTWKLSKIFWGYGNQINLLRYKLENNKEALGKGKVVQSLKTNPPVEAKNHS